MCSRTCGDGWATCGTVLGGNTIKLRISGSARFMAKVGQNPGNFAVERVPSFMTCLPSERLAPKPPALQPQGTRLADNHCGPVETGSASFLWTPVNNRVMSG